jgi:RNA polymerase sigma factor (sigma-70 family)
LTGYLNRLASPGGGPADAELLARYVRDRDETAFAALVDRHGPLVLGVCRRALGPSADADDAFQATFLALARSASRVATCVPGWLHRVALRACARTIRRRRPPSDVRESVDPADPFAAVEWRDVRRILDEEIGRLPDRHRSPLVLCHLQGLTRDEAADKLGWSLRTLHRRLDEARAILRDRLGRRGLGPALLAAAVLSPLAVEAHVSTPLARATLALAVAGNGLSESIKALVPRTYSLGGWAMKAVVAALIVAGGTILAVGSRQPIGAQPVPRALAQSPTPVLAPVKPDRPPDDDLPRAVRKAQERAIDYLKAQQKEVGRGMANWESDPITMAQAGGATSLALLALLETGVKVDDQNVVRGLTYLRTVEPKHTYVVGLQTQVFCRANQKEDADRIKRNVKWLEEAAVRNAVGLQGWSYTKAEGMRADNSNTRYAIAGLYTAHRAGFKPDNADFWKDVRDLYVRTQKADGGWGYVPESPKPTHTMTGSGLLCLHLASDLLPKDKAADPTIEKGHQWIGTNLTFETSTHTFYNFDVIAALGRGSDRKTFGPADRKRDWYREGAEWLLRNQQPDGHWKKGQAVDALPIISTSFALRFLASRPD